MDKSKMMNFFDTRDDFCENFIQLIWISIVSEVVSEIHIILFVFQCNVVQVIAHIFKMNDILEVSDFSFLTNGKFIEEALLP
jgi:hypothetical protein